MAEQQSNITQENNAARVGMNMDLSVSQIPKGVLTYALNAAVENFDANGISYQNESGNVLCLNFPEGFVLIGKHFINEQNKHIFFLVNPTTDESEIGYMDNNDCLYHKYINSDCLNFSIDHPIQKSVHKTTNCTTEVYWTDAFNPRRFLDLQNIPYKVQPGTDICDNELTTEIDCNKLNVQPNFAIPQIVVSDVVSGGNLQAGTVQFAIQYSNALGDAYTSYYSVTNPTPIAKTDIISADFNYPVGKSVVIDISNIDTTGYFKYFNLAVIKTVNAIASAELVGTYFIDDSTKTITYSGQNQTQIKLTMAEIFEKFPYYEVADDVTAVADTLVWKGLTSIDRINYQKIANKITLQWETWRIPSTEDYSDELLATNFRGYLRDEVYPYEIVFLLDNGKQTDGFHIPGRLITSVESSLPDILPSDPDYIGSGANAKYWQTYNTASVLGTDTGYDPSDSTYKGPYQWGSFAYWESEELYPCNEEVWGDLAGKPIRHHKFPDVLVSPIFQTSNYTLGVTDPFTLEKRAIFPIGVRIDAAQIEGLVITSDLTSEQKSSIVGFKIVRGDRSTNKSIIAKGILRNVGKYKREEQEYYFPNYPYNDLQEDPFLLEKNNSYYQVCKTYTISPLVDSTYTYTDCETNQEKASTLAGGSTLDVCSATTPKLTPDAPLQVAVIDSATYVITVRGSTFDTEYIDVIYTDIYNELTVIRIAAGGFGHPKTKSVTIQVYPDTVPVKTGGDTNNYTITLTGGTDTAACYPERLSAFENEESKFRHVFNSPETSFGQPFLGDVLKVESVIFGGGKGHFVQVKDNATYKLLTKEAQEQALTSAEEIAEIGGFNPTAMFTAYQAYLQIYINGITRRNYGWSYNSIASYNYTAYVPNGQGVKQRKLDIAQYLIPGVQSVGDDKNINNFNRESSVYLKTIDGTPLPYPSYTPSLVSGGIPQVVDRSRYINSQQDCNTPGKEFDLDVVSYYASIKNNTVNQWGQIYSYETIDTGTQILFSEGKGKVAVFGGDTFINGFAFKTKLPFFIDNTVKSPDDADIFYDEIGNVAYPEYWHSSRSILYSFTSQGVELENIISIKAHKFDCPNNTTEIFNPDAEPGDTETKMYYDGKMYLFAYGVPTFYVESSVNVDLRQAFNNREGDFYPHVSTGIPDDWVQEAWVPIAQDNTYFYNLTYSKQNRENSFSHLPPNWEEELCFTNFPFRAIYSEKQQSFSDNRINSWLIYRPIAFFDFPQNHGEFTSIDGIENRQVLARFSNKTLLYNVLYTNVTNVQGQVYLGQPLFSKDTPPLDYAETDLGYAGSQHKMLLKIPQGQITVDAKRGQIFLIQGSQAKDLTAHGSGMNRFFTDHLAFEILRYFPTVDIDNNFKGLGIHGVYDSKFERFIITKLDYIPLTSDVQYDGEFFVNITYPQTEGEDIVVRKVVNLTDSEYFCNKSWSLSFNMNTMSWVSFHSYLPNWYIAENNFFYSGLNESCDLEVVAGTIPDCSLEGTLISCTIAGEAILIEPTTTTTTSTTSTTSTSTSTTSTTTTTPPLDCDLEGTAEQV